MESAPARAQSRIPPFRLSKTVQPAPHKGQRRWLSHFSGQSSSADAKNGAKKRVFPKCLLSPRGTRAAGHSVSTHTMLRAALKHEGAYNVINDRIGLDTHNAACGIETIIAAERKCSLSGLDTHNAACGIETSFFMFFLSDLCCLDTHNAACGIETLREPHERSGVRCLDTHNAACGIETWRYLHKSMPACSLDTHNAACGIETPQLLSRRTKGKVSTHTMLRAALKQYSHSDSHTTVRCLDTHNAACGIDSKTALRVLSVTQSRFRMQKAHSNLDDAAHRC